MNASTGEITEGLTEAEMKLRGLVSVSGRVADAVTVGLEALNRAERRLRARELVRAERRTAKRSSRQKREPVSES